MLNFDDTPLRDPLRKRVKKTGPKGGKNYVKRQGHVAPPGTGPKGETCGTCKHIRRFRRYRKCDLARPNWTGGPGTDILARDAACMKWEPDAERP